jgi:polar amino acid transport system substrate-binding protein
MGDVVNRERNAMAVKKGNQKLRQMLNRHLHEIEADGTYAKLSLKYFGEDIRCPKL